ncbi:photoactive yellow protein [Oxalobacteraceae bacterium GrIS 2.11]
MEFLRYQDSDVITMLETMPAQQLDSLPYGVIKLDEAGVILEFNLTESAITGRNQVDVIGKNFFKEVAPCTETPEFYGKFQTGLKDEFLNTIFDYLFDYKMTPTRVKVHMVYVKSGNTGNVWIIVKRIANQ